MRLLYRLAARYTDLLVKAPFTTNVITGFCVAVVGDVLCQKYFDRSADNKTLSKIDTRRAIDMGIIRAGLQVPFTLFWYPFLVTLCPGASIFRVLGRVCIDQTIGSPIVIIIVFTAKSLLSGDPFGVFQRVESQFFNTWTVGLRYWPFVHTINFGLVPPLYQQLFGSIASIYWNAVLSYYANINASEEDKRVMMNLQSANP